MSDKLTWAAGFAAGQRAVRTKNKSGCCCMLTDGDENVVSPCQAHLAWLDDAIRSSPSQAGATSGPFDKTYPEKFPIPEGMVLVPREATDEMLDAGHWAGDFHILHYDGTDKPGTPRYSLSKSWAAMLAACDAKKEG